MSRLFDNGANEYLEIDSAVIAAYPLTLAAWFYSDDTANSQCLIWVGDKDVALEWQALIAAGVIGGDPVRAFSARAGFTTEAESTSGYSANTWHHGAAVFTGATNRAAFIDGRSKGTDAGNIVIGATYDRTSIGRTGDSTPSRYMSGRVAEAVALRIAATDYQVWLHAQGVPAPIVWPGWAIAAYWPLFEVDRDFPVANYNMSPFNTPSWAPHPPKVLAWWRKYMRGGTA